MSGIKKRRQAKEATRDINVTPLIDVVLVLLIIFMVITPILIEEMSVRLPEKTQQVKPKDSENDQLVAAACLDGSYALNKSKMDLSTLADQVRRRLRSKSSKIVFIDGHPDAGYNSVVDLIDSVRAAGADQIGIATLKPADQFRACGESG